MEPLIKTDMEEVLGATHHMPAVSIILPFEPKMSMKTELTYSLKCAKEKVEQELAENYPADQGQLVLHKLTGILDSLNFNSHKKSIAIYVSPVFEKVLYLDIPVEEKVMVDETFEIRDLEYSKKQYQKYLVLLLSM